MWKRKLVGYCGLICFLVCIFPLSSTSAKTYYLSRKGNDNNSGTSIASTWLSIAKVNATKLNPGDSVLIKAGDTINGSFYLPARDSGSATKPVVFSAYGVGKAAIYAKDGNGFYIYNAGGIVIQNLDIFGSGAAYNKGDGIFYYTDTSNGHKFKFIRVYNVYVHDFGDCGILMGSYHSSYPGYVDIRFTYVQSYDNKKRGILTYDMAGQYDKLYAHKNMYLSHFDVMRNGTDGITISGVDSGVIEYCHCSFTGINTNNGDAGIWVYSSNNVTIQYCISDHTYTVSGGDGEGFDLDGGCQNCVIQYCYAYQNSSCGFMHCDYPTSRPNRKNVIRYCLSENDGRKAANYNSSFLFISWGTGLDSCYMHNNCAYITDNDNGTYPVSGIRAYILYGYDQNPRIKHCQAMNNIFYIYGLNNNALASFDGGKNPIRDSNLLLAGNCYYAPISNSRKWVTESKTYTIYKNWQDSAGQEMLNGARKGYYSVDPLWQNAGKAGAFTNADSLWNISAYRLKSKSPLIGKGLNIDKLIPVRNALYDYYKDTLYPYHQLTLGIHEPQPPSKPIAGFYANNACMGDSIYFNDTSKYAITYHWDFGDKDTSADINPSHRYKTAGKYLVTLVARSVYGKTDTVRKIVEQYARPQAAFTTTPACINTTKQFNNNSIGATSYHWDFGNGDSSNVQSLLYKYKRADSYTIILTVKTSNGCKDTISHQIQVYALPKAAFSSASACLNSMSQFTNTSTGATLYHWSFGDGDTANVLNPDHIYKVAGSFKVKLQSISATGCVDTISKNVQVFSLPKPQFKASDTCLGSIVSFTNLGDNAFGYRWNFGDGDTSIAYSPTHLYKKSGRYNVILKARNSQGCTDSLVKSVNIYPMPIADWVLSNNGAEYTFKAIDTGQFYYNWDFGDSSTHLYTFEAMHTYKKNGKVNVSLTIKSAFGCESTKAEQIDVNLSSVRLAQAIQSHFTLSPNPFSKVTYLSYKLEKGMHINIKLYNASGIVLGTLKNSFQAAGENVIAINSNNHHLSAGVYFIRIQSGNFLQTLRLVKVAD